MDEETNIALPFWKNKKIILAFLAFAVFAAAIVVFSALIFREKSKMAGKSETASDAKKTEPASSEAKKLPKMTENSSKLFVFIQDKNKQNEKQLFTVPSDFYGENVAGIENDVDYKNGNLYIIRKMSDSEDEELWRYGKKDRLGNVPEGVKLYSGKIFKFNVSPLGKYIAITTAEKEKLVIIDMKGNLLKEYNSGDLGFLDSEKNLLWFGLLEWTSDEREFWGTLGNRPIPEAVYRINSDSMEISKFSVPFDQEWDLNADSKKIIYSDCPYVQDSSSLGNFSGSGTKVNLMVYDIIKGTSAVLESAVSKCFDPKWLNKQAVEYDSPSGSGRMSRVLN
jgi:hypothetical protein